MPRRGARLSPAAEQKNRDAVSRWHRENIENLSIGLRKGKRDAYKRLAAARGTSVSAMIQAYMDAECEKAGIIIERSPKMIDLKYYDEAVQLMDDDLREEIHAEISPCTQEEFLREYEKRHFEKYGEEFTI